MKAKARLTATPHYTIAGATRWTPDRPEVKLPGGITVRDFNWGAIFTGTKAQLVRAGLMPAKGLKWKRYEGSEHFRLPLNQTAGWTDACFFKWHLDVIPQAWDAHAVREDGRYSVSVTFDCVTDLNVEERTDIAVRAIMACQPNALELVKQIPPVRLSVALPAQIKLMDRLYGRRGEKIDAIRRAIPKVK